MMADILIQKIAALFIIMLLGVVLVKCGLVQAEDSRILSVLSIYLIMPCVIISAFQIDDTPEARDGLLLAAGAAVMAHGMLIALAAILKKWLRLDAVEQVSLVYSNAGNLIIPLVTAVLGSEWVVYSSMYVSVQLFLLWSHGKAALCGEKRIELKKVLTNVNMLSILVGIVLLVTGLRFPYPVQDAVDSIGSMLGPASMLLTGMLIGGMDLKDIFRFRRAWLISVLRLVVIPLIGIGVIALSGVKQVTPYAGNILLVTTLAFMTPSASTIPQMAQLYGKDANYASVINVMTTLLCIVTMPCMVVLYQFI